jgi:uncharacterized protein
MTGESNLDKLLKSMRPVLHDGEYVFCLVEDPMRISPYDIIMSFKEEEGYTIIVEKTIADRLGLSYTYISSWISLMVHSSLEAVGLTAAFSKALADEAISCNVVAGYHHDHIFLSREQADRAIKALNRLSDGQNSATHP